MRSASGWCASGTSGSIGCGNLEKRLISAVL
jgi:hypothetical protein